MITLFIKPTVIVSSFSFGLAFRDIGDIDPELEDVAFKDYFDKVVDPVSNYFWKTLTKRYRKTWDGSENAKSERFVVIDRREDPDYEEREIYENIDNYYDM